VNLSVVFESGGGSPALRRLVSKLGPVGLRNLHAAAGYELQVMTSEYLRTLASTRHATASKLGAAPSNHLAGAAEAVASPSALMTSADSAELTIRHPGMIRALRSVTIRPKTAKTLAIPIHSIAYNRRPAQIWTEMDLFIPKGSRYIAMKNGKSTLLLYYLVRSVTQPQDRTLLPSDEQFQEAAALGAKNYIRDAIKSAGL
jgi:hypothetical protein